ncbi:MULTISPECIES: alginate export family protein [unclassified Lentimicrobium]|uniref:alginate export family protein n=1 Tax=unclassified Lentimicrobium TaxID=2677434 RepID=UPI0015536683|nr:MULTISPECIES: alginate export family protein [unclassified Lentimicrobium]NPD46070.1 alginate export family protein [Lentimicrobium sp. S6]NPD84974.1 alginate export family protein [Lentimicrobium sp. L6]
MNRYLNFLVLFVLLISTPLFAQFTINAELRTRAELNHGLMTLPTENSEAVLFVSQRSRLNLNYKNEKFVSYFSIQDVRVWGENDIATKTGIQTSTKGFGISEAWFDWRFTKNWGLKTGRQIWNYDDGRLLSWRNWNQYGLAYDAFLLHLDKDDFQLHLGSSINNTWLSFDKTSFNPNSPFEEPLGYRIKYFNFLWMKFHASKKFSISLSEYIANYLAPNTTSTLYTLATTAVHFDYHTENTKVLANVFYQYGNKSSNQNKSSYMLTISGKHKINAIELGAGFEYISGDGENNAAFDNMYGARSKYNGKMNYYVIPGNTKNGGLIDLNANIKWSINKQHFLYAAFHKFWLETASYTYMVGGDYSYLNKDLGAELDLSYTYKYDKTFNIQAFFGYYFATETTEYVKGVPRGMSTSPYWASIMLTFKPNLLTK